MKKTIILLLTILMVSCSSGPSTDIKEYSSVIKSQAESMGALLLKKDYNGFKKFMHPKVIELMGGEKNMIDILAAGAEEMEAGGTSFLNVKYGEPSGMVLEENELQCILPQITEIKTEDGIMVSESTLIAVSQDGGKNWLFIDTSGQDIATMKKSLPNLSAQLVLPPKKEPILKEE